MSDNIEPKSKRAKIKEERDNLIEKNNKLRKELNICSSIDKNFRNKLDEHEKIMINKKSLINDKISKVLDIFIILCDGEAITLHKCKDIIDEHIQIQDIKYTISQNDKKFNELMRPMRGW
jgi:ATP-dependent helicase/DNAse subunit B